MDFIYAILVRCHMSSLYNRLYPSLKKLEISAAEMVEVLSKLEITISEEDMVAILAGEVPPRYTKNEAKLIVFVHQKELAGLRMCAHLMAIN